MQLANKSNRKLELKLKPLTV